jgi:hypothetical protein
MSFANRPKRSAAELIALINQRQPDWWPATFDLSIDRSAEHDWIAVVDADEDSLANRIEFTRSLGQVVADLRMRNAWTGE